MINTKFKIEKKELYYLLTNLITVKMFFTYPRFMLINSGNAAWIQCIFVSLIAISVYFITVKLFSGTQNNDLLDICEQSGGKWLKIIVGILLCVTFLINTALTIRALPESIKTVLLPLTPMRILLILSGITIALGALFGLYSIARIHALFMPLVFIVFGIMIILLLGDIRVSNIFPVFGKGTYNIFIKGLESVSIFSDIIALYILIPFCRSFNDAKKSATKAILTSFLIVFLIVFIYNTVYSYPASEEFLFPVDDGWKIIIDKKEVNTFQDVKDTIDTIIKLNIPVTFDDALKFVLFYKSSLSVSEIQEMLAMNLLEGGM